MVELDRVRGEDEVQRLRVEMARVYCRHGLTVDDVRAATLRAVAAWQSLGGRAADLDETRDVLFAFAVLGELKRLAQGAGVPFTAKEARKWYGPARRGE